MKRTVRTLMVAGIATVALTSVAQAIPVYTNVNHDGNVGTGAGNTYPWTQVSLHSDTTTVQYDTDKSGALSVGDRFADSGNANWTEYTALSPRPLGTSNQNLNNNYEVSIAWTNLSGKTTQIDAPGPTSFNTNTVYDGGTFNFYFKNLATRLPIDYGSTTGSTDDTNVTNGLNFLTIQLVKGTGTNTFSTVDGSFLQGASQIYGKITNLDPNYLFQWKGSYPGVDLNTYVSLNWLVGDVAQNTQTSGITFTPGAANGNPGVGGTLFTINSRHDGSMRFDVVPEPGTMILLGSGLLGLAGYGRKRTKKS